MRITLMFILALAAQAVSGADSYRWAEAASEDAVLPPPRPSHSLVKCATAKRAALIAARENRLERAEELESWVAQHCRRHADALRKVSESMLSEEERLQH